MAEFCLDCFNKLNRTKYTKSEVWLETDFCEGCAEWKPCIVDLRPKPFLLWLFDSPKKIICLILAAAALVAAYFIWGKAEEKPCTMCDSFRYHAPVLFDLEDGSCIELDLYFPHETKVAEIQMPQPAGQTFSLISIGDVSGYRDTTQRRIEITVPAAKTNNAALCSDCQRLLADSNARYILADLYAEKKFIAIENGVSLVLRCYEINMTQAEENNEISVVIQGILEE